METPNCQTEIPKTLPNQSPNCPCISRAPLPSSNSFKPGTEKSDSHAKDILFKNHTSCQHAIINQSCPTNCQINMNECPNLRKLTLLQSPPSIQQSSTLFLHFLRLMQLFPDVHPASLHTTLVLCKNDFFLAIDKLLYAKKYKQTCHNQRSMLQTCSALKCNRLRPYILVRPPTSFSTNHKGSSQKVNVPSHTIVQGCSQLFPLDGSIEKMQVNQDCPSSSSSRRKTEKTMEKRADAKKPKIKIKLNEQSSPSTISTDLLPIASAQCMLPICPISPIKPEDLSKQPASPKQNINI